tara:strand:+ start:437 stop:571 length:135 start_codon:yes stop_codon:yes gene_type:complete
MFQTKKKRHAKKKQRESIRFASLFDENDLEDDDDDEEDYYYYYS